LVFGFWFLKKGNPGRGKGNPIIKKCFGRAAVLGRLQLSHPERAFSYKKISTYQKYEILRFAQDDLYRQWDFEKSVVALYQKRKTQNEKRIS
jgi:hypothetical protein